MAAVMAGFDPIWGVTDPHVRVPHPERGDLRTHSTIIHRLEAWPGGFFGQGIFQYHGLLHEYRVVVEPDWLASSYYQFRRYGDARVRALWEPLAALGDVAPQKAAVFAPDKLCVARLIVNEIPHHQMVDGGETWGTVLQHDEDEHPDVVVYRLVERLRAIEDGATLRHPLREGGSLLWLQGLEVHPAFAGQRIGTRLVWHVLWELARSVDDLAFLEAFPVRELFVKRPTKRSAVRPAAVERIVGYHERLGFTRAASEWPTARGVPMYRHVGAFGIPVDGLGSLSVRAGYKALGELPERFRDSQQPTDF